jgi:hypothetical protein
MCGSTGARVQIEGLYESMEETADVIASSNVFVGRIYQEYTGFLRVVGATELSRLLLRKTKSTTRFCNDICLDPATFYRKGGTATDGFSRWKS